MMHVLDAVKSFMSTLIDNEPKPALHIGEAMGCWTYLIFLGEATIAVDASLNITIDQQLVATLKDAHKLCDSQIQRLRQFMIQEGVELPQLSNPKPRSEPSAVPAGVKLTDEEIANALAAKTVSSIISCATNAAQSVRSDVGMMWIQFQAEQVIYGTSLKTIMRNRGWIKLPPSYSPPGIPNQ